MNIIKHLQGRAKHCGLGIFSAISNKLFATLCVLTMLALSVIILFANKWTVGGFAVLMGGIFIIAGYYITPIIDKLSDKKFRIIFLCFLIGFSIFLFYIANSIKYVLPIDSQVVYDSVSDVLDDGVINQTSADLMKQDTSFYETGCWSNSDYFVRCYNNIALLLLLVIVYFFGGLFGIQAGTVEGQTLGIGFNVLCIALAVLFTCLIVRKVFKRNSYMLFTLFLFIAFVPLYYSAPNFYTDTIVLAPVMFGVWLFLCYLDNKKWFWGAAAGIVLGFATHLKITAGVIVVALVMYSILSQKNTFKYKINSLVVFFGAYIAFMLLFVVWYKNCGWFDFSRMDEIGMPAWLWMCFGAHGDGGYNAEDVAYAYSISGYDNRSSVMWKHLCEIYRSYSFGELLEFWYEKMIITWNYGRFDAEIYALWPLTGNWTTVITQPDRKGYIYIGWFSQVYMLMLYLFGLTNSIIAFIRKKNDDAFLFNLSIFGTILYLIIFEAAPRRALIAIPFFICCTIYVFDAIQNFIKKKVTAD